MERRQRAVAETLSRAMLAAEMALIALPTALFFVIPFVVPAAVLLTPIALFGLGGTLRAGGPNMGHDLWVGLGVLSMSILAICTIVALLCLLGLAGAFLVFGRPGLARQSPMLRRAILFGAPPVLFSSIPKLFEGLQASTAISESLLPTLLYSGLPLLIPAGHLAWEVRVSRLLPPAHQPPA